MKDLYKTCDYKVFMILDKSLIYTCKIRVSVPMIQEIMQATFMIINKIKLSVGKTSPQQN